MHTPIKDVQHSHLSPDLGAVKSDHCANFANVEGDHRRNDDSNPNDTCVWPVLGSRNSVGTHQGLLRGALLGRNWKRAESFQSTTTVQECQGFTASLGSNKFDHDAALVSLANSHNKQNDDRESDTYVHVCCGRQERFRRHAPVPVVGGLARAAHA